MTFKCNVCDHVSTSSWNSKVHRIHHHSTKEERAKERHYCADCDVVFFDPLEKKKHMEKKRHKANAEKLKATSESGSDTDTNSNSDFDTGSDSSSDSDSGED